MGESQLFVEVVCRAGGWRLRQEVADGHIVACSGYNQQDGIVHSSGVSATCLPCTDVEYPLQ